MPVDASRPLQPVSPLLSPALEFAVSAAGVGIWEIDAETGEEVWSDLTLALYGLPAGSVAPTRNEWREKYLHPDDAERAASRATELFASGRPYELDYRIRRADGQQRWLHTRAAFAQGSKRRIIGVSIDITERKEMEARAEEALNVLDLSAAHAGFGFGWRDIGGREVHWSHQLKAMYGFDPLGPTPAREEFLALVEPLDRERILERSRKLPDVGLQHGIEYAMRRKNDGRRRIMQSRAVVLGDSLGGPTRHYFAVIDVTEEREREQRMAELLERLRLATEASGIGVWTRDLATGKGHWDATMRRLFGLAADAPVPSREAVLAMVHPDDLERVQQGWLQLRDKPMDIDLQFRIRLPDGGVRWLQTRGSCQVDSSGVQMLRSGITYDISERRAADEAREAQALAERANAAKTEFLSRMSHELRTPLNAVLGFAQLMAIDEQERPTARQRERLDHILAAGWHLLALINDVLDLTRIEARQLQIEMSEVDLVALFGQCAAMNQVAAQQSGVRLVVEAPEVGCTRAWADVTRLKQLLVNLVSNAIKYNVQGGEVRIGARRGDGEAVVLTVSDTGLGMSAEQLAQLFQPFNRLGRENSGVEGSGIGLIVAKLLAEQMGGRLEVSSEAGRGSEFRVVLAARQGPAA